MPFGEGGGPRAGGQPVRGSGTRFDVVYPANGDVEAASLYLREVYRGLDVQPKIDEFTNVPLAQRETDKKLERELELRYRLAAASEGGGVLEHFLNKELDRNDWLGGGIFRTTKFDDYHGIDAVVEWDEADRFGRYPRVLVDFTSAENPENVDFKLRKLTKGGDVKYFRSPFEQDDQEQEKQLSLHGMPVVILGIEKTFLPRIAGIAKQHEKPRTMRDGMLARNINEQTFRDHPLQILLLEQAITQADVQVRGAAAQLLNLEKTIGDRNAADTLDALRYRIGSGRITPEEMIDMIRRIEPALHAYQEKNRGNAAVMSNVLAIPKWENLAAVYQLLQEKKAAVKANKNADQLLAARAWKSASVTHNLLTRLAA